VRTLVHELADLRDPAVRAFRRVVHAEPPPATIDSRLVARSKVAGASDARRESPRLESHERAENLA